MSLRKKWLFACAGMAMAVYAWYGLNKPSEPAGPPILYAEPLDWSLGSAPAGDTKTKQFKLARHGARQERDRQEPRRRTKRLIEDRPVQIATPTWRQEHGPVVAAGEPIAPSRHTNRFATEPVDFRKPPARQPKPYIVLGFDWGSDKDNDRTNTSRRAVRADDADVETELIDPELPTDPSLLTITPDDVTGGQVLAALASPVATEAPGIADSPVPAVREVAPAQTVVTASQISHVRRPADQFGRAVAEVMESAAETANGRTNRQGAGVGQIARIAVESLRGRRDQMTPVVAQRPTIESPARTHDNIPLTISVALANEARVDAARVERLSDAIDQINRISNPAGVNLTLGTPSSQATHQITVHHEDTARFGANVLGAAEYGRGAGNGVGNAYGADYEAQVTIFDRFDFYTGDDNQSIGQNQFDYQTVVTHELLHVLGLTDVTDEAQDDEDGPSIMDSVLAPGIARRDIDGSASDTLTELYGAAGNGNAISDLLQGRGLGAWQALAAQGNVELLTAVPEPATALILTLAGVGLLRHRRRR